MKILGYFIALLVACAILAAWFHMIKEAWKGDKVARALLAGGIGSALALYFLR